MESSHGKVHSDTAKKEQIITEIFAKSLHIVLESRAPYVSCRNYSASSSSSSSSPSSNRARDKWFNLTLRECPDALKNIDFWRQSNLDPMVIDIILIQRVTNPEPAERDFQNTVKVIERWVVQYESSKSRDASSRSNRCLGNLRDLYKKSVLLLRSLYATVRLLPAYKLFRELTSSGQIRSYTLTHRVNSFVEPFTRKEEADMRSFSFGPVETSPGRLCLSVLYHNTSLVSGLNFEQLTHESPQLIPDYVGSPIVDPIKRIPVSQSLPSYAPTFFTDYLAPLSKPRMSLPHNNNNNNNNMEERFQVIVNNDALVSSNAHLLPPLNLKPTKPRQNKTENSSGAGGSVGDKFSLGRDENGRFSTPRISSTSSSPHVSLSASSTRVSIPDVFDDADFPCYFVDDDDDMQDPGSRPGSSDRRKQPSNTFEAVGSGPARKSQSQDATLGALILMLKRAPPLQRNRSSSTLSSSAASTPDSIHQRPEEPLSFQSMTSSGLALTKTAADAVTELSKYSSIKERLLRQSNFPTKDTSSSWIDQQSHAVQEILL